jgi:hypothetical protein
LPSSALAALKLEESVLILGISLGFAKSLWMPYSQLQATLRQTLIGDISLSPMDFNAVAIRVTDVLRVTGVPSV